MKVTARIMCITLAVLFGLTVVGTANAKSGREESIVEFLNFDSVEGGLDTDFEHRSISTRFKDRFKFKLSEGMLGEDGGLVSNLEITSSNVNFRSFKLRDVTDRKLVGSALTVESLLNEVDSSLLVPGHKYKLIIKGKNVRGSVGEYSGELDITSAVSPVPEVETYAMLLAGLLLIGFAARRRKLKI